ncbi:MAG: cobalamin-dependent protein, partial [Candidatus Subteraquimicrobiales bacterium]|nr:cobalamin-dependent protein [Candidatus Subteraquimicrobiales bacterium]
MKDQSVVPFDVVLLYPKTGLDVGGHTVAPPHSSLAIAAPVYRAGYRVKIIDMRRDYQWRDTLKQSVSRDTICIGVTTMTGTQVYFALLMANEARRLTEKWGTPIVWGGSHPSILPEQTLQHELVDIVAIGEGDESFPELVDALAKKQPLNSIKGIAFKDGNQIVKTERRPLIDVNKLLPVPWELINVEDYIVSDNYFLKDSPRTLDIGQTSRGCPFRCGFCSSSSILEKRWRGMTVERALEAIFEPVHRFNLTGVWIRDDEFYINNSRAFSICEGIV